MTFLAERLADLELDDGEDTDAAEPEGPARP